MYVPNNAQQLSFNGLTVREQKMVQNSWAACFSKAIFPRIDKSRFDVLYSDKASRPNTPVNIVVGALIIKEMLRLSDDEMVNTLMADVGVQYTLHTTSMAEQALSDKTLTRFRNRRAEYMIECDLFPI